MFGPINPKGTVVISECSNKLDGCEWPNRDCLKIGPSNNLLTYHAIYFLNQRGFKANPNSIASLLASHYLYEKSRISYLIGDRWRTKKEYSESRKLYEASKIAGLSPEEISDIKKIQTYEKNSNKLEANVLRNVKRSLRVLHEKEHNVVKKESGHYIVLGDVVETSERCIELPDQSTYSTTISRISKFNKWMSKAG
jgi:hypothetical protein